jgi:thiol-disulfide isomerase/thioredoxin
MVSWSTIFAEALPYAPFLDRYATAAQRARWTTQHGQFQLLPTQRELLGSFVRSMPVLCVAATWCGDCIEQCPVFDHLAQATSRIAMRFLDRDANPGVRDLLAINGGYRVPVVVFLSEDWFEVSRYGERTLSIYRRLAGEQVVNTCSTGIIAPASDTRSAITAEWLAEFERAQLILRLSPRLRAKYRD